MHSLPELTQRTAPFELVLADNTTLQALEVVRTLPTRRVVVRAVWRNQAVYAKLFYGTNAQKYFARDVAGVTALTQAGVLTPPLLYHGSLQGDAAFVAIFSAVEASQNAEIAYANFDKVARFSLMQQLAKTVAQHHQAGLIQTDLYFKNFLVKTDSPSIYTLDGDGIRPLGRLLKRKQKLNNLATLFSKMDVQDDVWISGLTELYCAQAKIPFSIEFATKIWVLTQKIRAKVSHEYADKKVFRNCTDVKVAQDYRQFLAVARDFLVEEKTLNALDDFLKNPAQNIKNGNTCTIAKAVIASKLVVIKRYNIKSLWHGLSRASRKSRAAVSWANAFRLNMANIVTPKPLALVEKRMGMLRGRAYFVSEFVDAPDIAQFFAQTADVETKQQVALEVATLFYRLSLLKISHGDCKATNIKIKDGKPLLLDLDAMQANAWNFRQKHVKDLKRFMRNWQDNAELTAVFKQAFSIAYDEIDDPWIHSILMRANIT